MSRVLVVGFGVTGQATVQAVLAGGDQAVVIDDRPPPATAPDGVELIVAPDLDRLAELVAGADLVVPSPGVPVAHPVYELAARAGVSVVSEVELAWRQLASQSAQAPGSTPQGGRAARSQAQRLVAITGTNGKTTVTTLVCAALARSGIEAVAAGNIGLPLVAAVGAAGGPGRVIVAEVSSFQLQFTEQFHPSVSCWLNLAEDHLDWHPSPEHYRAAKARIWANQGPGDTIVVNADDDVVMSSVRSRPPGAQLVTWSTGGHADWYERDGSLWCPGRSGPGPVELMAVADLARALPHDRANALAAAAVASAAGASLEGIRAALAETQPLAHRVELVGDAGGVCWYDDSKATTPASVMVAVAGFDSVVLIAGGRNKGLDLRALAATVPPVRAVVAIGEASGEVAEAFAASVPVTVASTMAGAVDAAGALALEGDAVVLSPGCASFDWYASYAERGDDFAGLVRTRLEVAQEERGRSTC